MTDLGAEETRGPLPSSTQKQREKGATKPSPKLQNLGHRSRYEQIHHAPDVEGRSEAEALQYATSPGAYGQSCSHEGPKMQENIPENNQRHAAKPRIHEREEIRHPSGGKPAKCPSLSFLAIHRGKDRYQMLKSAVCHGLGVRHRDREMPSAFCVLWSRIELSALHRRHFRGLPATLGQEARNSLVPATGLCAPSHASKMPQSWIQMKIPSFISKEVWLARSLELDPMVNPGVQVLLLSSPNCGVS